MSIKNQLTKSDFLEWNESIAFIQKLERDGKRMFAIIIAIGIYTGLRIGDIKQIRWIDLIDSDSLSITEKKTKKHRKIRLNEQLKVIIKRIYSSNIDSKSLVVSHSPQYINRKLKEMRVNYKLKINNISTHTFRKTFGRHVWEIHNHSEKSLILLSELFNHSSTSVTKRYLGIKEEELQEVYNLL